MNVDLSSFRLQKAGNAYDECEDKVFPKNLNTQHGKFSLSGRSPLYFAIADGATEGMLSSVWAEILVKAFCRTGNEHVDPKAILEKAFKAWDSWFHTYLRARKMHGRPIQWYEEPGLEAGAFSTLLGLMLQDSDTKGFGSWEVGAIGDTCVFQVRGERLISSLPIADSSGFNTRPFLIRSKAKPSSELLEAFNPKKGEWQIGDSFFLTTDALACWFLQEFESGDFPWRTVSQVAINTEGPFERWVDELRDKKKLKNDDVTLVIIKVTG